MRFHLLLVVSTFGSALGSVIVKRSYPPPTRIVSARDNIVSLNPPTSAIVNHNLLARKTEPQTNGKRLALGLPPLPPKRRWGDKTSPPQTSPAVCQKHTILISSAASHAPLGYLSKTLNDFGEFANNVTTSSDPNALLVCISKPSPTSHFSDISVVNGMVSTLGYLGAFKGYASQSTTINAALPTYLFLGQVAQTGPSSIPSIPPNTKPDASTSFGVATEIPEEWESNVWSLNQVTQGLELWWTNPDGTAFQASIAYLPSDGLFVATGDPAGFAQTFQRTDATLVTFSLA